MISGTGCYVCEGHIELGLKGQRDTAMQSEQNKTVPVVPLVAESVCHVCG